MQTSVEAARTPLSVRLGNLSWLAQAASGVGLVVLAGLHMFANHFVVAGGLRDFEQVQSYLRQPLVLVVEVAFLMIVVLHSMLGVRAGLFDLGLSPQTERRITAVLTFVGVLVVIYGLWLTWVVITL